MKITPLTIGLYSPGPGHGKTTVAYALKNRGFEIVSFAEPLRSMAYSLLMDLGLTPGDAWRALHESKNDVIPSLGVSGRYLLRTLGTEWGRDLVHQELWLKSWIARAGDTPLVVVDDVRFPNEAEMLRKRGAVLWLITSEREGFEQVEANHRSDGALGGIRFERHVRNDSNLGELVLKVEEALDALQPERQVLARC